MYEQITLKRDIEALAIPSGTRERLREGTVVTLTQSFGESFTILGELGSQYRVDGADADALGLSASSVAPAHTEFSEEAVWNQMKTVFDPEIPVNIVDLGLVYSCKITPVPNGNRIDVSMTMTAPGCGMAEVLKSDVERQLRALPTVAEVEVAVVFDPPWHPGRMSEAAKLQLGFDLDSGPNEAGFPMYGER